MTQYKPFDFDPLVNAANALTQFEKSYREKAIAQANEPVWNPFHNHTAPPIDNGIVNRDREIDNAQREFNEEIKSIHQWHQSRREQVMQELERIDRHHNEMVEEYTAKFANRLSKLYVKREDARIPFVPMRQTLHTEHYNDEFEHERFRMEDLIDIRNQSNRMELNPERFPRHQNTLEDLEKLEEGKIQEYLEEGEIREDREEESSDAMSISD
jgi:hypothetical protein